MYKRKNGHQHENKTKVFLSKMVKQRNTPGGLLGRHNTPGGLSQKASAVIPPVGCTLSTVACNIAEKQAKAAVTVFCHCEEGEFEKGAENSNFIFSQQPKAIFPKLKAQRDEGHEQKQCERAKPRTQDKA